MDKTEIKNILQSLQDRQISLDRKLDLIDDKLGKIWSQILILRAPQIPDPNYLQKLKEQIDKQKSETNAKK